MIFWVKVPVLSLQMFVALPMISQHYRCLTRLFSSFILLTEKASEIVTAKGSPSGTATTMIVTEVKKAPINASTVSKHRKQWSWKIISIPK